MINQLYAAQGWVHAQYPQVDVPKPEAPDSKDIVNKVGDAGDWLSIRSKSFWLIIGCLIITYLVGKALKNPVVKGIAIGVILLAIVIAVVRNY